MMACQNFYSDETVVPRSKILWSDVYTLIAMPGYDWQKFIRLYPEAARKSLRTAEWQGLSVFRVPAEYGMRAKKQGFRTISDPPFKWIDPDIESRRYSEEPAEWWSGYKDDIIIEKILRNLAHHYPDYCRLLIIGKSREGKPVYALKISDHPGLDEDEPTVLLNGAHHGNEPLSIEYTLDLANLLLGTVGNNGREISSVNGYATIPFSQQSILRDAFRDLEIYIVPAVNPDGVNVFWNRSILAGRRNTRDTTPPLGWNEMDGVDLNRNYPFKWKSGHRLASSGNPGDLFYRGPSAGSEIEVQNMMTLAEKKRFFLALSFHSYATKVLFPYTIDGAAPPQPMISRNVAELLAAQAESFRQEKAYTASRNLYPVDGTDQDWFFHTYGTLAFIVEGSHHSPVFEREGIRSIIGMRGLVIESLQLHSRGPTLKVIVKDPTGKPMNAQVRVANFAYLEGEKFYTNPKTGRLDIFVGSPGRYTVLAETPGKSAVSKAIDCSSGVCDVKIVIY